MAETTVGTIIGYLRLDNDQAMRALHEVNAEVDKLDTQRADVTVKADTSDATRGLAEVAAEAEAVDRENVKISSSSRVAGSGMGALAAAAVTVGPAIVPLAAGAAGLAAGFGAMGAAGIAAFFSIKKEMADGTGTGALFSKQIEIVKTDFYALGQAASAGLLTPLEASVQTLNERMPLLVKSFGEFGSIAGLGAQNTIQGLVAGFIALTPVMQDASMYALSLSERFSALMQGPGVAQFGAYIQSVFPQVTAALESVAESAVRIVAALAPLGMGTLSMLQTLATIINAIPVDVLSVLAQVAQSVFIAFKTWEGLSGIIAGVGEAMGLAAGTMTALSFAAGGVGIAVGLLVAVFAAHAESQRQDAAAVSELTDAFKQSNGAMDDNVQAKLASQAADAGMADSARQLGISFDDITLAAQGNTDALGRVNEGLDKARQAGSDAAAVSGDYGAAMVAVEGPINRVSDFISAQNGHLDKAKQAYGDFASATAAAKAGQENMAESTHNQALLQDAAAVATDADAKALKALNDQMDKALGKSLSLAQAQTAFDAAVLKMKEDLDKNKGSLDEHTKAGIQDRQAIESAAQALQRQRDAQIKAEGSTVNATNAYAANGAQLLETIGRLYGAESAAYKYAAQLLAIPPSVATQISAPGLDGTYQGVVNLAGALNSLHDKQVFITTTMTTINKLDNPQNNPGFADGGVVKAYASGGMENHVAQIAPAGAMRLWAEPETGGEAYIPLAPSKRARSLAIWDEVGHLLGAGGSSAGPTYQNTFHMPPVDAEALAALLEAKQSFQLAVAS